MYWPFYFFLLIFIILVIIGGVIELLVIAGLLGIVWLILRSISVFPRRKRPVAPPVAAFHLPTVEPMGDQGFEPRTPWM